MYVQLFLFRHVPFCTNYKLNHLGVMYPYADKFPLFAKVYVLFVELYKR